MMKNSIFLISFFNIFASLNGLNYIDPGFNRLEYSYAKAILQPYTSKNISKCSFEKQFECFRDAVFQSWCLNDISDNFDAVGQAYMNKGENAPVNINPATDKCIVKKFNDLQNQRRYLWILEGLKDLREEKTTESIYPNCEKNIKECEQQCPPIIPYHIIEKEILANCSQEAFKKFGVKTAMIKTLPPENELEKLSFHKIGSTATSKAAQELTFNDLENMKFVAAKNPELEKYLCNRETKFLSLDNPDPFHRWFTLEEYEGMKALLEENDYFRWSFCSGVYAITSSSNLVCFPSHYKNCGDVLRNLPSNDNFESLKNCRKIARADEFHHAAICN